MMGAATPEELLRHLMEADDFGLKLEVVRGTPTWEFFPSPLHQLTVQQIYESVKSGAGAQGGCACFRLMDAYLRFADGSLKRPDLSIFCTPPPISREAIGQVPDAVVEVVSPGSEVKDLELGPPFYLSQGVRDVVVVDPETSSGYHFRRTEMRRLETPARIELECGCTIDV